MSKPPEKQKKGGSPRTRPGVEDFLAEVEARSPAARTGPQGRLYFGMDATMSRQPTWDMACQIQGDMFLEADKLGGLAVKLAFFRGHGEMKSSPWITEGKRLLDMMSSVRCRGGLTQIEKLLGHALSETRSRPVQAIVYVGDACEEPADPLCHLAGELGMRSTPVFVFHEGGDPTAARAFREIARLSGGAYAPFDAGAPDELRALLRTVARYAAGGQKALSGSGLEKLPAARKLIAAMKTDRDI